MSGRGHHSDIGFGGAVGLGVAAVLLIGVFTIGHAVLGQLQGAARVVVVFLTVALCVALGGLTVAILGALWYFGGLAWLHLAERRMEVGQLAEGDRQAVTAEVLEGDPEAMPQAARPAILGKRPVSATGRHLETVPGPPEREGFRRTFLGYVPKREADRRPGDAS